MTRPLFQALSAPAFRARGLATGLRRVHHDKQTPDENQYHVARFAVLSLGLLCSFTLVHTSDSGDSWSSSGHRLMTAPPGPGPSGTCQMHLDALHAVRNTAFANLINDSQAGDSRQCCVQQTSTLSSVLGHNESAPNITTLLDLDSPRWSITSSVGNTTITTSNAPTRDISTASTLAG